MGQHTLRRASGISTTTGRAIFTGIAVLGLASGGAGMAFAGEYSGSSSDDHDVKGDHDDDHDGHDKGDHDKGDHDGHGKKHHKKHHDKHEKPEACEIPIYANLVEDVDALDEDLTDDATKAANEASAALAKPVEDALCPVIADELNGLDDDLGPGPEGDEKYLGTSPTGL
jgi:hypothetical protein